MDLDFPPAQSKTGRAVASHEDNAFVEEEVRRKKEKAG